MSEIDERKPTYEELLEDKKYRDRFRKQDNVFASLVTMVVMQVLLSFLAQMAIDDIPHFLKSLNADPGLWAHVVFSALSLMWAILGFYLVWHFTCVLVDAYKDEIKAWFIHHNFRKQIED